MCRSTRAYLLLHISSAAIFFSLSLFICFIEFIFEMWNGRSRMRHRQSKDLNSNFPLHKCNFRMCLLIVGYFRIRSHELLSLVRNEIPIFIYVLVFSLSFSVVACNGVRSSMIILQLKFPSANNWQPIKNRETMNELFSDDQLCCFYRVYGCIGPASPVRLEIDSLSLSVCAFV